MATTITTVTPTATVAPWEALGHENRGIARAEIRLTALDEAIAAPGVGNIQSVFVNVSLPQNYAYVLIDCGAIIKLEASGAMNWATSANGLLSDSSTSVGRTYRVPIRLVAGAATEFANTDREQLSYAPLALPKVVVRPAAGSSPALFVNLKNETSNDGAATVDFFARFLMYEVNQANDWEVNSPILVR